MNFYLVSEFEFEWDDLVAWEIAHIKGKSSVSVFNLAWWFLSCKSKSLFLLGNVK